MWALTEEMLMMRPQPRRAMPTCARRASRKQALRSTSMISSHSAFVASAPVLPFPDRALLTRMSRWPRSLSIWSMAASAPAASVVSKAMAVAPPPAAMIATRVASMPAAFRPLTTTWAPHPASARAMDRPSPRDAPVTSATLPSSEKSFVTFDLRFAPVYSFGFPALREWPYAGLGGEKNCRFPSESGWIVMRGLWYRPRPRSSLDSTSSGRATDGTGPQQRVRRGHPHPLASVPNECPPSSSWIHVVLLLRLIPLGTHHRVPVRVRPGEGHAGRHAAGEARFVIAHVQLVGKADGPARVHQAAQDHAPRVAETDDVEACNLGGHAIVDQNTLDAGVQGLALIRLRQFRLRLRLVDMEERPRRLFGQEHRAVDAQANLAGGHVLNARNHVVGVNRVRRAPA